jgi:tRNA A-37 threonylcarbamoyl transferase component Bud32
MAKSGKTSIETFDLEPGRIIAGKYKILSRLGSGWEGEVFSIAEVRTDIERTAKLFFPHRNVRNLSLRRYARKLHKLRHCPIVIQYHTEDVFRYKGQAVAFLVSEYVAGDSLTDFLKDRPGRRLDPFEAVHLLYSVAKGVESIHLMNEYHGDLHTDNIIVGRFGLEFEVKLLDLFHWDAPKSENRKDDICNLIRILYDCIGGPRHYAKQPLAIRYICSGLKTSIILKKFPTVSRLCRHLETMEW